MTAGHAAGWRRLQQLSCYHAIQLGPKYARYYGERQHCPPEVIRENVEILGKGSEEEVKARIHWYLRYYPDVFENSYAQTT